MTADRERQAPPLAVDPAARPAPAPTGSAPKPDWFCLTCGLRTKYLAAIERHCGETGHYRYSELGMGL
jgi:hypothetical protein